VGRSEAAKGEGVIRDPNLHRKVLKKVLGESRELGFFPQGLIRSPLLGPKGNTEFLVLWSLATDGSSTDDDLIRAVFTKIDGPD
jgi:23S rRNA (cytidine1920-2'-O)/16S rRNA (cytidine1409-2'-O)-methyltransferase